MLYVSNYLFEIISTVFDPNVAARDLLAIHAFLVLFWLRMVDLSVYPLILERTLYIIVSYQYQYQYQYRFIKRYEIEKD